jgi:hypothetical protein
MDFRFVQEEFPRASGLVILAVPVAVRAYVSVEQKGLALPDHSIAVLEIASALANRFHFCACKRDAAL